jgi:hypothetical protein
MERELERQIVSTNFVEQQNSDDLVQRIRKLRWLQRDDDAARVQAELAQRRSSRAAETVIAGPVDTD